MDGDQYMEMLTTINVVLSVISIGAALVVAVMIVGGMVIDKKSMDRVSIRIMLAIAILDILLCSSNIVAFSQGYEGVVCILYESASQWIVLAYMFLNTSIAVNLQLVFVNDCAFNPKWERAYWIVSFGLATILASAPLGKQTRFDLISTAGYFLDVEDTSSCIGYDPDTMFIWHSALLLAWVIVACVCCSAVVTQVIYKLLKHEYNLRKEDTYDENSWQGTRYSNVVRPLICRV
ncbi:hypothetical protein DSO57_1037656 [Entomophthora muscae]|uniref:Uncharacterized protein n=1 Tax=Entomophthora muscae TaxID=34485 RepID=A0ACC2RDP7_9FUNG|nr:hypothetical protein DSO57_1037656 [Entomophthora muscae]